MTPPFRIVIVDDGFLGKYVGKELSAHPVRPGQETVLLSPSDYSPSVAAEVVVDAAGAVDEFPAGCLSISLGAKPCSAAGLRFVLPPVVGTGMGGGLLAMARAINGGWYFNVGGDESRMTVVHAVSVASAVRLAVKDGCYSGDWLLTDGLNPLRRDVASGLAERLGQKRVYTLPLKWHKFLARLGDMLPFMPFSSARLKEMTADSLAAGRPFTEACPGWHPVDTVNYLKTHDYSDDDF